MSEDLINRGVQAAQSGDNKLAQNLLLQAVRQTPHSAIAWYWLGKVVDDPENQQFCLHRALEYDPTVADQPQEAQLALQTSSANAPEPLKTPSPTQLANLNRKPCIKRHQFGILLSLAGLVLLLLIGAVALLMKSGDGKVNKANLLPDMSATQMYKDHGFQITAARELLDEGDNARCIEMYDDLLTKMPHWFIGYYNRGICKRLASTHTHSLSEYTDFLTGAIADQDQAISFQPDYSNAYVERAFDYMSLAESYDSSADDQQVYAIALENINAALALGTTHSSALVNLPINLIHLNRCQEGVDEANRQLETTLSGQPRALLYEVLALGYQCLGDNSRALQSIEKCIATENSDSTVRLHTSILIGTGTLDKAFNVVTRSLQEDPTFNGYRYFQRALIYYDRGDIDLARQDLDAGYGYTWYHGGLYSYLMGMIALHDGDRGAGVKWLKEAASSMHQGEGLWLKQRIEDELARQNVKFEPPKPGIRWKNTPIPPSLKTPKPNS